MKTKLIISFILLSITLHAQQIINSGNLIQGGIDDGEKLIQAYLTPINKAIVYGLSDVTYTKFKTETDAKKFTISVKMAYVPIPTEDITYDVSKLDLQYIEAKDPTQTIAQSVFGSETSTITLASKQKDFLGRPLFQFESPAGGGKSALTLPFLGLNYRLDNTNVGLNLIPYVTVPDSDIKVAMVGLNLQQNLASFIEDLKDKPYGISLQGSYAYLFGNSDLYVRPEGVTVPVTLNGSTTGPYDNQKSKINYSSIQLGTYFDYTVAEKYTFFGGVAYNMGASRIQVLGTYPIYGEDPSHTGAVVADDIEDPIDIKQNFNRMKFELGARADWKRVYVQLNYNIATYGGLGINIGYKML